MQWVTWTCDLDLAPRRLFVYDRTCWAFEVCLQKESTSQPCLLPRSATWVGEGDGVTYCMGWQAGVERPAGCW